MSLLGYGGARLKSSIFWIQSCAFNVVLPLPPWLPAESLLQCGADAPLQNHVGSRLILVEFPALIAILPQAAGFPPELTHTVVSQYTAECRDSVEPFFSSLSCKVRIGYSMLTYILFTAFFCSLNFPISVHFNGCLEDFLTSHVSCWIVVIMKATVTGKTYNIFLFFPSPHVA